MTNEQNRRLCLCDKHGDLFGCGDGWTICDGFCVTAKYDEDRELLIKLIERLTVRNQSLQENLDNNCKRCQENCKPR